MKKLLLLISIVTLSFPFNAFSQNIKAETEDGKKVILKPNGTWEYVLSKGSKAEKTELAKKAVEAYFGSVRIFTPAAATEELSDCLLKIMTTYNKKEFAAISAPHTSTLEDIFNWSKDITLVDGKLTMGDNMDGIPHTQTLTNIRMKKCQ